MSWNLDPKINFWWGIFDFNDEAKTGKNFKRRQQPMEPSGCRATQVCEQTAPNSASLPSTLTDDGGGHGGPTQGMNSFKIGTSAEDAQNKVDSQAPPPPPDLELIPDEVQKPAADWTAFRVGVRYDPPLLALEWKGDGKTLRKDIPFPEVTELAALVAEVADDGRRRSWTRGEDARPSMDRSFSRPACPRPWTRLRGAGLRGDVVGVRSSLFLVAATVRAAPPALIVPLLSAYHRRRGE